MKFQKMPKAKQTLIVRSNNERPAPKAVLDVRMGKMLNGEPCGLAETDSCIYIFPLTAACGVSLMNDLIHSLGLDARFESFEQYASLLSKCSQLLNI